METDKTSEYLSDILEGLSDCCGAKMCGDICSECKEHCDPQEEDSETSK